VPARRLGVVLLALTMSACETPLTIDDRSQETVLSAIPDDAAAYVMHGSKW
jgi:hypothetical protein